MKRRDLAYGCQSPTPSENKGFALILDKSLAVLLFPLGFGIGAFAICLLAVWRGWRRFGLIVGAAGVAFLWICSTPLIAGFAVRTLEAQYPAALIEDLPQADVAIVLGGGVQPPDPVNPYYGLSDSGDRVLHAARLWRAGKVDKILVTGGNLPWRPANAPEAEAMADFLLDLGVGADVILIEAESRNTYQNAIFSKVIWDRDGFKSGLLVTSVVHMPRALATFRAQGFVVEPASTDPLAGALASFPLSVLPDVGALLLTTKVVNEWVGLVVYRLRGWAA